MGADHPMSALGIAYAQLSRREGKPGEVLEVPVAGIPFWSRSPSLSNRKNFGLALSRMDTDGS